jgi:ribonuclease HI
MGVHNCILKTDSKVIARQIEKECIARDSMVERYLALVWRMKNYFRGFSVEHISRSKNAKADELAKAATRKITMPPPPDVFIQTLEDSLIKTIE